MPSAKIALELEIKPTAILPPAKTILANIEITAIFSFILILHLTSATTSPEASSPNLSSPETKLTP